MGTDVESAATIARGGARRYRFGHRRRARTVTARVASRTVSTTSVDEGEAQSPRLEVSVWWVPGLALAIALLVVLGFMRPTTFTSPTLRAVVETAATLLALAAAELTRQQFMYTRRLRLLLLLAALLILALVEFVGNAIPAALQADSSTGFTAVLPLGQLIVAVTLALSALTPSESSVAGHGRPLAITAGLSIIAFGVAEGAGLLLRRSLMARSNYSGLGLDHALQHPLGLTVLVAAAVVLVLAAIQFARQARREGCSLLSLLAAGALLLAGAKLYYLTLTRVSPDVVSARELLRLLGLAVIFAAALRQEVGLRANLARAAALAERRRVAQDLHDGLAQDLAFITAHGHRMAEQTGSDHPVVVAARHALALSRDTISELTDPRSSSAREALEGIAHELSSRFGIRILVDVHPTAELAPDTRGHAARIAREAIANAARHGGAENIVVSLKRTSCGVLLRVSDDGSGIDSKTERPPQGFGMRSMQERAAALGGVLTVRARGRRGTDLDVILPSCVASGC